MLESWRVPHSFALLALEGEERPLPPTAAVTYGPIAGDLVALAKPTPDLVARLGRSLGFEWVASLTEFDRPDGLTEPALTRHLREQYALSPGAAPNPFTVRRGELVRQRVGVVQTQLLSDFVSGEHGRLADVGKTIGPLVRPFLAVATGRGWDVTWQPERAAVLFNALEPPMKVRRLSERASGMKLHALEFRNLYARALLEIVELYNDRPPLRICGRCKRLFVPHRSTDKYCRRYTWPAEGGEPIAGCAFDEFRSVRRADLDARARRREYTRLRMRVDRREKAYGSEHPMTLQARRAFDTWKAANVVPRGRRPNPMDLEHLPDPQIQPIQIP